MEVANRHQNCCVSLLPLRPALPLNESSSSFVFPEEERRTRRAATDAP